MPHGGVRQGLQWHLNPACAARLEQAFDARAQDEDGRVPAQARDARGARGARDVAAAARGAPCVGSCEMGEQGTKKALNG